MRGDTKQEDKEPSDGEHWKCSIPCKDCYDISSSMLICILAVIFSFFLAMIALAILLIVFSIWL